MHTLKSGQYQKGNKDYLEAYTTAVWRQQKDK